MIGTTLRDVRNHIEALVSADGDYYLVCGRYGDRPVPTVSLRVESRPVARVAARAAEQYRRALRRYDPQLPTSDVIVCQDALLSPADRLDPSGPTDDLATDGDRPVLIKFCHLVAGAVFEAVAASAYRDVERAIKGTYLERAETIGSPDELSLRLLESTATELYRRVAPEEQARVLAAAAARLSPPTMSARPLEGTIARLRAVTLTEDYALTPGPAGGGWEVTLSGYALAGDRLVTLPLAVELFRRSPDPVPAISGAERVGRGTWSFRLTTAPEGDPSGLVAVGNGSEGQR